jgi:uncharacterized protein
MPDSSGQSDSAVAHRPAPASPTHEDQRLPLLDVLRGFALFGVLLVNLRSLSLYGLLPAAERAALPTAAVDAWLASLYGVLVDGTAITLFSILFGIGFTLQMRDAERLPGRRARFIRRMAVLLLIGLAHGLLWWGDILRYYAVLGLLLLPLARCSPWLLAALGGFIALLLPPLLQPWLPGLLPAQISSAECAAQSLAAFSGADWHEVFEVNLERDLRMRIAVWSLPAYVFGRLLIGAALGRSGLLLDVDAHARTWRRLLIASLLTALACVLLVREQMPLREFAASLGLHPRVAPLLLGVARDSTPLAFALFYLSAITLLFRRPVWRRRLLWLAPVGRLALSNYLAQSLVGIALFYGIGLGLGPDLGLLGLSAVAVVLFALQQWLSRWWLARFAFGPAEWLWRSATYLRWQPLRRAQA